MMLIYFDKYFFENEKHLCNSCKRLLFSICIIFVCTFEYRKGDSQLGIKIVAQVAVMDINRSVISDTEMGKCGS